MSNSKFTVVGLASLMLAGCTTTLETRPVAPGDSAIEGVEYWLPALELTIPVTRRLVDCSRQVREVDGQKIELIVPKFEFRVEPAQELVPSEQMVMNYADMSRPWKTSDFAVEWHDNRMLKKVNVSASDKSAEIALEVLKAGIGVAKLAGGITPAAGAAEASLPSCPAQVESRKELLRQKKAKSGELAIQTTIIEAFNARDRETLTEDEKKAHAAALGKIAETNREIAKLDKKLDDANSVLAYTETSRWRPASAPGSTARQDMVLGFELPDTPSTAEEAARVKWIKKLFGIKDLLMLDFADEGCEKIDEDNDGYPDSFRCRLEQSLAFVAVVEPLGSDPHLDANIEARTKAARDALGIKAPKKKSSSARKDYVAGIVTRTPVAARLFGCSGTGEPCHRSATTRLFDERVSIPQFGRYGILPFTNGFGQDNKLEATFAANGVLTSLSYKEEKSSALAATQTLNQGAEALLTYATEARAYRDAQKEKEEGAALKAVQNEVALLEQQVRTIELQAAVDPANVELAQQASRLTAQLEVAKMRKDLVMVESEIARLETELMLQPESLALLAEKERLEIIAVQMHSRVAIAESCATLGLINGCT